MAVAGWRGKHPSVGRAVRGTLCGRVKEAGVQLGAALSWPTLCR